MLKNDPFYHQLLKKYTMAFGSLFNEIKVEYREPPLSGNHFHTTEADRGAVTKTLTVPLRYARKDKALSRIMPGGDPEISKKQAATLPMIAFELESMEYSKFKQLNPSQDYSVKRYTDSGIYKRMQMPVPYYLFFNVFIFTATQEVGNQILEQILPYFSPTFSVSLDVMPEMSTEPLDSAITLESCTCEDKYEGKFDERRPIIWSLRFKMPAYMYPRIKRKPLIKFIKVDMFNSTRFDRIGDAVANSEPIDRVTVQPGLLANGSPTTNVEATIPYADIDAEDDWDYASKIYGTLDVTDGTGGE
jgi:hypothetical protein